jgi:DNA-binding GntR family transcriptional regulator
MESPIKTTVSDRLFLQLNDAIVTGKIPAGSKISEPELAKQYDVSRAPLREAIARLEACNLVTRKPNVGARVVKLSFEELLDIYRIREALEGMAARLAAESMNDEQIDQLRAILEDTVRAESGDLNHDFHYAIVQGSGNARLSHLLCDDLYSLMRMYR